MLGPPSVDEEWRTPITLEGVDPFELAVHGGWPPIAWAGYPLRGLLPQTGLAAHGGVKAPMEWVDPLKEAGPQEENSFH